MPDSNSDSVGQKASDECRRMKNHGGVNVVDTKKIGNILTRTQRLFGFRSLHPRVRDGLYISDAASASASVSRQNGRRVKGASSVNICVFANFFAA